MTYAEFKENFLPEFLNIRSFAAKIRYANEHLTRIGSGTGRIVFDIDGEKVLKLAKNAKGIAQNEAEAGAGYYRDTQHIVTEVFDSADDNSWLIVEKANKVTEKRIKELTEIPSLTDLYYFLRNFKDQNNGGRKVFGQEKETEEFFWENEFAQDLTNFIANYNQSAGDMGRPSTYGEVLRDGQPSIVLTDYGLNDEVYNTHYSPDRKQQYRMYELFNYADGNDDILSDAGGGNEIRTGMWAQMPYSVGDGDGVINEEFINFVSNRNEYPDKPIAGLPVLTDNFHECVNNIRKTMMLVENKEQFYGNLLKLQEYLIRRGFYNREPLVTEEFRINESDVPDVEYASMDDKNYATKIATEVAGKLSLGTPKYLGGGGFGHAYEIDSNVVLKITSDWGEADAASRLTRVNPKYLGDVYHLYKVHDTDEEKSFFVILEENIQDKPTERIRKMIGDINKISPNDMDYEDVLIKIKNRNKFNYDEMIEHGKAILTANPEVGVSQQDRQAAYEYFVGLMNIRNELLEYGIKSTDYITTDNLGYKDGVLKFFDIGGHPTPAPNVDDTDVIQLPEDGSAKFSTGDSVGRDGFPTYNTNDTSPSINNSLDANTAMYEDLEYNHVKGDATDDEYMLSESRADFLSWKRKNVTIRGMEEVGKENNGMASFGQGLYTAALGNKELARKYGTVYFVLDAIPKHPKIVNTWNDAEIFMQDVVVQYGKKNNIDNYFDAKKDFDAKTNVRDEMLELGYDGLIIKGREMVNYTPPEDVKYFRTEQELEHYYDTIISDNNISEERNKSFGSGSKTVEVKKKCKLGGLGNTSAACNQGDINNLVLKSIKEELENSLDIQEYFSSLVPDMNEQGIMSLQDLPFKAEVEQLGGKIFSVGGAVRDEFLGKDSKDLDILVTGIPMKQLEQLLSKYGKVNLVGEQFGVLKFVPSGETEEIDIAIPRTEAPTGGGGHKDVDVASDHTLPIEKDLERRDFTINAIGKDSEGNIVDPYGGQEDLKNKIIRAVNPEAFSDDPLRMLRAVQFASRFGFTIEPQTMKMIKDNAHMITNIPPERFIIEFDKIVNKGDIAMGAKLLKETGLFAHMFGEVETSMIGKILVLIKKLFGRSDNKLLAQTKTMGEFIYLLTKEVTDSPSELFKTQLKGDIQTEKEIRAIELANKRVGKTPAKNRVTAHQMYGMSPASLESDIIPNAVKQAAQELLSGKYPKTLGELAVNGNDLMGLGMKGKEIGDALKNMLIKIYSDEARNSKEELLSLVSQKPDVEEGYLNYSDLRPSTWNINGQAVTVDFFVQEYDRWNTQNGARSYPDASHRSVLEFLQNNYEDFSVDDKLRKELYWALTDRDLLTEEEPMKKVRYSAVVLDDKSHADLLKVFGYIIPKDWKPFAHHMTIKMGALEEGSKEKEDMEAEKKITLNVIDYAIDDLVIAVGVTGYPTANAKPHVTLAVNTAEGGKPFLSNKLTDWRPLGFPLTLTGTVNEER